MQSTKNIETKDEIRVNISNVNINYIVLDAWLSYTILLAYIFLIMEKYIEELEDPNSPIDYCVSLSSSWIKEVTSMDPEFRVVLSQLVELECEDKTRSIMYCIQNDLRKRLMRRFKQR
ncbi:hypothetical protein RF11_04953 [Thelohanellus kitauei]|uniref:Uncharacterized protein n=1 Tax=Thelohanellus kitauei TaxID=669202 RepID=A0A0C2MFZ3_THEKT|nr:hypothetical protein RF11_04953 [Thelohanellus kitauei]